MLQACVEGLSVFALLVTGNLCRQEAEDLPDFLEVADVVFRYVVDQARREGLKAMSDHKMFSLHQILRAPVYPRTSSWVVRSARLPTLEVYHAVCRSYGACFQNLQIRAVQLKWVLGPCQAVVAACCCSLLAC